MTDGDPNAHPPTHSRSDAHLGLENASVLEDANGRRRQRRPRPWLRILLAVVGVGLVIVLLAGWWVYRKIDPPGGPGAQVTVDVPKGSSTARIADLLDAAGVVADARVFRIYSKIDGGGPWQAGTYVFRKNSAVDDAIAVLDAGPQNSYTRLTIPEGYTLEQIAERVGRIPGRSAQKFLELANGGAVRSSVEPAGSNNLEGLLYPDTYQLDEHDDEARILQRMVQAMDQKLVELGVPDKAKALGVTPYQLVTIASMIEREARVPDERPKVARVVYNRLERGMRLGIDATTRYELKKPTAPLRKSELERDSPYNTRTRAGLPPTPISNPGAASLDAAANPADGTWIYYVIADAEGHHTFATTDAEFQRAKRAAQQKGLL
jgi:UPF0755 protein